MPPDDLVQAAVEVRGDAQAIPAELQCAEGALNILVKLPTMRAGEMPPQFIEHCLAALWHIIDCPGDDPLPPLALVGFTGCPTGRLLGCQCPLKSLADFLGC